MIDETGRDMRQVESDRRIADFLRRQIADARDAKDADMRLYIRQNREIAAPYKILSEQGVARFCLLQWAMQGEALHCPEIHDYLTRDQGDPEEDLKRLIDAMAEVDVADGVA